MPDATYTPPAGWTVAKVPSDWWVLHTLTHTKCGWTSEVLSLRNPTAELIPMFHVCREEAE